MIEKPLTWLLDFTDYWGKLGRKTKHDRAKLARAEKLLAELGNPEKDFKIVHVVGTKGKGSVAAMLAAIATKAGIKTGLYTSPHVEEINERITIDGQDISYSGLNELITEIRPIVEKTDEPCTFFEVMTAIALLHFQRSEVELAVLEAGMGGAFSATNACDPVAVAITNIGFEHADALGPAFADIVRHKAGAIRKGIPVFTTATKDSGLPEIRERCRELDAPLHEIEPGSNRKSKIENRKFLKGRHQKTNAALAALIAEHVMPELGRQTDENLIGEALSKIRLPARIEVIGEKPLVIIDGAHTPESMADLAGALENDFKFRNLVLVVSMKETKQLSDSLRPMLPLVDHLVCTRYDYPGFAEPGVIEEGARKTAPANRHIEIHRVEPVTEAFLEARKLAGPEDAIVIAGSFYLAGEARSWFRRQQVDKETS